MAFPTAQVSTTNLDSSTDDPSAARADLLDAVQKLNTIIDEANAALGVALLNSSGKISATAIPNSLTSSGTLQLKPSNGVVSVSDILRMNTLTTAETLALVGSQAGDMVMVSDGDSGEITLAVYNGSQWRRIELMNAISDDSTIPPNFSN
jgi:hypothetical protein